MELLRYDPATGVFTWRVRRGKCKAGEAAGYVMNNGYVQIRIDGAGYLAHRLAWLVVHGEWPPAELSHVNGDRRDNRLANLRINPRRLS